MRLNHGGYEEHGRLHHVLECNNCGASVTVTEEELKTYDSERLFHLAFYDTNIECCMRPDFYWAPLEDEQHNETMHFYTLALQTGGLMEDPEWHYEDLLTVYASNLREAKDLWATKAGRDTTDLWNSIQQSYWGWAVVCLGTDDSTVEVERIERRG